MKKQQSGFTLIELIMVIVVLGILAAFAIPKFADLGGDARRAVVKGAYGSIKSAAAITHSSFLAQNLAPLAATGSQTVKVEGGTVALAYGYPTAAAIAAAAGITAENFNIPATITSPVTFTAKGAADPTKCGVTYTEAAAAGGVPAVVLVDTDLTGC